MPKSVILALAAALAFAAGAPAAQAVEEPKYSVVSSDKDIEVRDYPALIVAETVQRGDRDAVANSSFRRLADYIFEKDRPEGKIEMTAPVLMAPRGAERTAMQFIMPREHRLSDLPKPENPAVRLRTAPARRMAAIRFSGWADDEDLAEKEAELRAWLAQRGLKPVRRAVWAFYNPPWTLGPWRRNEVLIQIRR